MSFIHRRDMLFISISQKFLCLTNTNFLLAWIIILRFYHNQENSVNVLSAIARTSFDCNKFRMLKMHLYQSLNRRRIDLYSKISHSPMSSLKRSRVNMLHVQSCTSSAGQITLVILSILMIIVVQMRVMFVLPFCNTRYRLPSIWLAV